VSFSTLNIASSALSASQRAVETAAHNVANSTTDGYTRQRLSVSSAPPTAGTPGVRGDGMRGTGVQVLSIDRLRDALADVAYRAEASGAGFTDARAGVLDRTQGVLGPYPDGTPELLQNLYVAFDELARNPADSPAARDGVLNAAHRLAGSLNAAARSLGEVAVDVGLRVTSQVAEVNQLAERVARLNQAIADARVAGQSPNDLLDQRDIVLDQLAEQAGATFHAGDLDMVDVYVGNSVLVTGVTSRPLAATTSAGATSVSFADGQPAAPGGALGGYVATLTTDIPGFQRQLDDFAASLSQAVNTVHQQGYDLDGQRGGPFFTGSSARTIAVSPDLTARGIAAGATPSPADADNAQALADVRTARTAGGATLAETLHAIGGSLGAAAAGSAAAAGAAAGSTAAATRKRAEANGVSVDEEMVDLLKFQHAYSAAARVLSVADEMIDRLINGTGAGR